MINFKSNLLSTFIMLACFTSCSNNSTTNNSSSKSNFSKSNIDKSNEYSTSSTNQSSERTIVTENDPYEMMQVAFEGTPEISKIKPLLEAVIEMYDLPKTDEYRMKVGSMLISLRKASTVGVTEMEILKHIYQYGSTKISLPDQAGLSATLLGISKGTK